MFDIYLFDWGDTLMVDFPDESGKMCHWSRVAEIEGAFKVLQCLSNKAQLYVATGAAESTEADIQKAFARVGLAPFISGYFCKHNLGFCKGEAQFLPAILSKLGKSAKDVAMVGDSLEKDIYPALKAGIHPIWFNSSNDKKAPKGVQVIQGLTHLLASQ